MSAAPTTELKKSGLAAAREARREVASLMHEVAEEHPRLGKALSGVVATLFSAEVGDARKVHTSLSKASAIVRELLGEDRWLDEPRIVKILSRSLALMQPASVALGRALGVEAPRDDATAPFLLTSARVKPDDDARLDARSELDVEVGLEGDNRFYSGTTGDISAGGLFVSTDTPLMVGTELTLSFVLPDGYRVATGATVAWVRAPRYRPHELPSGMGIRFDHLSPADRNALTHFLRERPPFRYGD